MVLLVDIKHYALFTDPQPGLLKWAADARIPIGTPIEFRNDLPEEDNEGRPIFAFSVSAGEVHYWRGEPIRIAPMAHDGR
jgi:hypothetical protein